MKEKNKDVAQKWIENGGLCTYRDGWGHRGAKSKIITQSEALKLLPKYEFEIGFYNLDWRIHENNCVLEFNELSANDLH